MTDHRRNRTRKKVRASVIRRTIVFSLVVMLSPMLTVLEHDASASVDDRMVRIARAASEMKKGLPEPTLLHSPIPATPNRPVFSVEDGPIIFKDVEESLRAEAQSYWSYENMTTEASTLNTRTLR